LFSFHQQQKARVRFLQKPQNELESDISLANYNPGDFLK
jgi:hypothetical protein